MDGEATSLVSDSMGEARLASVVSPRVPETQRSAVRTAVTTDRPRKRPRRREEEAVRFRCDMAGEVELKILSQRWWDVNGPKACVRFGLSNEIGALHFDDASRDLERPGRKVDVGSAQFRQLSIPQSAPTPEEDRHAQPR